MFSAVQSGSNPEHVSSSPELFLTPGATAKSAKQRAAFSADSVKVQEGENKGRAVSGSAQHMIL